ncbi:MAG TPA: hypothetical protein VFO10_02695 [Oligoflexus sp.]|uniref:hypothetical protein n=1 Tax=Oligoflexus sp. TaxID=1971216 RepID=UPI002D7ED468|nr:hypothetical protein [Oligoflexus sp.]HET9236130.1 hypothetical protein [Oligoflexus sp.]
MKDSMESMDLLDSRESSILQDVGCGTIHQGHAYYVFQRNTEKGTTTFLLRSDRQLVHVVSRTKDDFHMSDGSTIRRLAIPTFRSWSDESIRRFVKRESVAKTFPVLFQHAKSILGRLVYADESAIDLMAAFAILSFFTRQFHALPYLHLTGNAGSGKSAGAVAILKLSFNGSSGELVASFGKASSSAIFRSIADNRGTVVLDDHELISDSKPSPLRQGLLVAYKAASALQVLTIRGKTFPFDLFGIRILTSIQAGDDVINSRLLRINLLPAMSFQPATIDETEIQALRDDLHTLAMTEDVFQTLRIAAAEASSDKRFHGRFAEITIGLRALASLCGVTLDLERYYPARAAQHPPAVNMKALVMGLLKEGYRDLTVLHVHAAASLAGSDMSLTKVGLEMAACGLLKASGSITIFHTKSTRYLPTKRAIILAGGKLRRSGRSWCQQSHRKQFIPESCSGCRFLAACGLKDRIKAKV